MKRIVQIIFVLAVFVASASQSQAQERVFSEYQYDEVGNIISRIQDVSGAAPSIIEVSPGIVRRNQTLLVTLTGEGLRGASLGEQNSFFSFSDITSSNEELSFTLAVDIDVDEGPAQITVSTGLGTASFSLNVLAELPDLRISPTPITLTPGAVRVLNISLSIVDVLDHSVVVSVADTSVATLSTGQIGFDLGSIAANQALSISALSVGSTALIFESATLGTYIYNVTVTNDEFVLTPGSDVSFNSQALGLNKLFTPPPPALIDQGPFITELRINKLFTPQAGASNVNNAFASPIGLLKGRYHLRPAPKVVGAGVSLQQVTIQGRGLADVTSVELTPNENVVVSDLLADASGDSISFNVSVDAGTPLAIRRLTLQDTNGNIEPASGDANRIYIGGGQPLIESISPIFLNRGDARTITVRGVDLDTVRGMRFDNEQNLSLSNLRLAPNGRSLTFSLEVLGFARIGPRVLTLESLLGDSTALNAAANVLNIEDSPPEVVTPVISAAVGVSKLTAPITQNTQTVARANAIGVTKGSLLSAISPNARSQGSTVTLGLSGIGLNSVISAEFEPAEGIVVNDFTANASGTSATLSIDIANDAAPSVRKLRLLTDSATLQALAGADRFTVTLPRPQITSVSPLLVDRSQTLVPITLRGELLDGASRLTVIPSDGITASIPVASADGRSAQASLTLSPDAPLVPRILQLTTPGGVTESLAMLTNTVQVVSGISNVVMPIVSAQVGVIRQQAPVLQDDENRLAFSGVVGIVRPFTPPPTLQTNLAYANPVGLTKGPAIFTVSPFNLPIGTVSQTLEVTGSNLDNVITVQTVPADGVTLSGPAIISNDGTMVTFSATVDADAPQTARRLELLTADGSVPFVSAENSQIRITSLQPELASIDPIQQVRGASFTMTIRGINLNNVQSIQATPPNGIQFGTAIAAADARSLTVSVVIAPTATTEQKVITVTTNAGTTTSAAMPENTFTVISE